MTAGVWPDGFSALHIEHEPDERVRFRIDSDGRAGHSVEVSRAAAEEIADYIRGGRA